MVRFCQIALAVLACLSSARPDIIRCSAESLFRALLFLDGDGVWLILTQVLDAAGVLRPLPRRGPETFTRNMSKFEGETTGDSRGDKRQRNRSSALSQGDKQKNSDRASEVRESATDSGQVAAGERGKTGDPKRRCGTETGINRPAEMMRESIAVSPYPPPSALAGVLDSGRPCQLLERRSVLVGTIAKECAPAAARLLDLVNTGAATAERM